MKHDFPYEEITQVLEELNEQKNERKFRYARAKDDKNQQRRTELQRVLNEHGLEIREDSRV